LLSQAAAPAPLGGKRLSGADIVREDLKKQIRLVSKDALEMQEKKAALMEKCSGFEAKIEKLRAPSVTYLRAREQIDSRAVEINKLKTQLYEPASERKKELPNGQELAAAAPKRPHSFMRAERAGAAGERPNNLRLLRFFRSRSRPNNVLLLREQWASARTTSFSCALFARARARTTSFSCARFARARARTTSFSCARFARARARTTSFSCARAAPKRPPSSVLALLAPPH
jgi:hypothetical protein